MSAQPMLPVPFDQPRRYRITVQGRIGEPWLGRLEGMQVTVMTVEAGPPVTELVGDLPDQAALAGVLNTLYELRLTVISVESLQGDSCYVS